MGSDPEECPFDGCKGEHGDVGPLGPKACFYFPKLCVNQLLLSSREREELQAIATAP